MTSPAGRGAESSASSAADPGVTGGAGITPDQALALERALADIGIACEVEVQGRLALLIPTDDSMRRLSDDTTRRETVGIARAMGFSHVAIELRDAGDARATRERVTDPDAPLPRD